ncbi:NAD(P)-binding protein, partial [bacterium]|nr:NAD(P)-binding protein [bacterium]
MFEPQLNQVIIVGSGIVGAYTAVKLRKALPKLEIVILEAGNEHPAPSTKKQVHSDLFYDWSLTEGLGGNSNLWGGLLAKADQLGFEKFKVKGFDAYDDLLHHYDNVSKTLGWHNFDATKVSPEDVVI